MDTISMANTGSTRTEGEGGEEGSPSLIFPLLPPTLNANIQKIKPQQLTLTWYTDTLHAFNITTVMALSPAFAFSQTTPVLLLSTLLTHRTKRNPYSISETKSPSSFLLKKKKEYLIDIPFSSSSLKRTVWLKKSPCQLSAFPQPLHEREGRKISFRMKKPCNYFQLHPCHSSDLCSLKGDLLHTAAHEPTWSTSTGELHQKSAAENVAAANTACKEVSGLTIQSTPLISSEKNDPRLYSQRTWII